MKVIRPMVSSLIPQASAFILQQMAFDRDKVVQTVRLASGIDPSTPEGLSRAFARGASECFIAAEVLDTRFADTTGEYILLLHCIELALKAFMIKCGMTEAVLRKKHFGHDLVRLYEAAEQHGLQLNAPDIELIRWVNEWHNDGVKIRYEFGTPRALPMCEVLLPIAAKILDATRNPPV